MLMFSMQSGLRVLMATNFPSIDRWQVLDTLPAADGAPFGSVRSLK